MSRFVTAFGSKADGFPRINLDLVAKMEPVRRDGATAGYRCISPDGEVLGTISALDAEDLQLPVTADTTGSFVVTFALEDDGATISTSRYPVVAWRHELGVAEPVCAVRYDDCSNVRWCIELTTGIWVYPEDREFDSLAGAAEYAIEMLLAKQVRG